MGSMCCKKLESPYSPKLPDFNRIFLSCTDQIQLCRKNIWDDEETEPKQRKFSVSDISYPLPLGCTIIPPKRPPRKKKFKLERTTSARLKSLKRASELRRTKSIHEIHVSKERDTLVESSPSVAPTAVLPSSDTNHSSRVTPPSSPTSNGSPTTDEIVLNVIRAASGPLALLDSPSGESSDSFEDAPDEDEDTNPTYENVDQFQEAYQRPYYLDSFSPLPPLEPIMESAYESLESGSSLTLVAENKKHFLAALLEDTTNNNSNNNLPSRKSSITESLREFECSLYDMLEQESIKDDVDEIKWRPQIPVYSYH